MVLVTVKSIILHVINLCHFDKVNITEQVGCGKSMLCHVFHIGLYGLKIITKRIPFRLF